MMKVWVAGIDGAKSSAQMVEALNNEKMESVLFSLSDCRLDLDKNTVLWHETDLSTLDGIAVRKLGDPIDILSHYRINLLRHLEYRGVRIFSSPDAIEAANNRYSNTLTLKQGGVPVPKTIIAESVDDAVDVVNQWGKTVLKPLFTSKGRGMVLLDNGMPLRETLQQWQKDWHYPFYLQEYISAKSDMGVAFLKGGYIGTFQRIAGDGSWQTTIRSGGRYAPIFPSTEIIETAWRAANCFNLDYTVVDVVCDGEQYLIYEVSAFGGFSGLSVCNIDAAGVIADFIKRELTV
jgi:ribosomal protein S6--L-glutamate ligase